MMLSLYVMAGSALGGLGRYWLAIIVDRAASLAFPWGTLLVNVLGSMVIGLAGSATDARLHADFRAFLMVGVCGGFTTFSSFSLQTLEQLQHGRIEAALAYVGLSVLACLLATWAGYHLGKLEWR